jgi:F-type H+-transporting ATPase subunit b
MEINWFTYLAQIVNFLVLIALLKRFLYQPITKAMEQRKLQIKATVDEANEQRIAAEAELEKYRQQNLKLQEEKEEILLKTREEAEQERQKLLAKIQLEIEESKRKWYQEIAQERAEFLVNLRRKTLEEIYRVLRLSLAELANYELQQQILNVFLERLEKQQDKLQQISNNQIKLCSAFLLTNEQKSQIAETLAKYTVKNNQIIFETSTDLICGISLIFDGQEIVWSLENYLQNLSENLTTAINN